MNFPPSLFPSLYPFHLSLLPFLLLSSLLSTLLLKSYYVPGTLQWIPGEYGRQGPAIADLTVVEGDRRVNNSLM